jgi:hypothetical protein
VLSRRRPWFEPGSCEICGGQSGTGAGFLWVLRVPLPIVPLLLDADHHSSSASRAGFHSNPKRTKYIKMSVYFYTYQDAKSIFRKQRFSNYYFWRLHPIASITTIFLGAVNRNSIFRMFFITTISYPLHVSASTGHLQVEYIYWLLPKELFFLQRIRCSCFG